MENLMKSRIDEWGILELQNCILNIAKYIDSLCVENDIHYYLMGGSALGAVRHSGFIPWDDDMDIFMTPKEYSKFKTAFTLNGDKSKYYLQEYGTIAGKPTCAKLRLNHSTYIEFTLKDKDIHHGVFVDIFILHNSPDNIFLSLWQYIWTKYIVVKNLSNNPVYKKNGFMGFILKLFSKFPKHFLIDFAIRQMYLFTNENTEYVCHYMGKAKFKKGRYKREYFKDPIRVNFEKITLYAPSKLKEYLVDRWGNYMKLPSIEEIKKFQHGWKWSVDKTFPGYKPNGEYLDEKDLL